MNPILTAMSSIFFFVGVGVLLKIIHDIHFFNFSKLWRRVGCADGGLSQALAVFVLNISLPALIGTSILQSNWRALTNNVIIGNFVVIAGVMILIVGFTRLFQFETKIANAYIVGGILGSVSYLAPRYILTIFPYAGETVKALLALHYGLIFILGMIMLEHYSRDRRAHIGDFLTQIICRPIVVAVLGALTLSRLDIALPDEIMAGLIIIGKTGEPLILIAIGFFAAKSLAFDRAVLHAVAISIIKLFVVPSVFFYASHLSRYAPSFHINILETAMPVSLASFALTSRYPIDKKILALAILISSLLSIISLTLLHGWLS